MKHSMLTDRTHSFNQQNPMTTGPMTRRKFLTRTIQAGAILAAPQIVPGRVLGMDGGVAPSETVVLGAIGIGNRGSYVLGCFLQEPDVRGEQPLVLQNYLRGRGSAHELAGLRHDQHPIK